MAVTAWGSPRASSETSRSPGFPFAFLYFQTRVLDYSSFVIYWCYPAACRYSAEIIKLFFFRWHKSCQQKDSFCKVNCICLGAGYYCLDIPALQFSLSCSLTSINLLQQSLRALKCSELTKNYWRNIIILYTCSLSLCRVQTGRIHQLVDPGHMSSFGTHAVFPLSLQSLSVLSTGHIIIYCFSPGECHFKNLLSLLMICTNYSPVTLFHTHNLHVVPGTERSM